MFHNLLGNESYIKQLNLSCKIINFNPFLFQVLALKAAAVIKILTLTIMVRVICRLVAPNQILLAMFRLLNKVRLK